MGSNPFRYKEREVRPPASLLGNRGGGLFLLVALALLFGGATLGAGAEAGSVLSWVPTGGPEDVEALIQGGYAVHEVLPEGAFLLLSPEEARALARAGWQHETVGDASLLGSGLVLVREGRAGAAAPWREWLDPGGHILWEREEFVLARVEEVLRRQLLAADVWVKEFRTEPRRRATGGGGGSAILEFAPQIEALVSDVSPWEFIRRLGELSGTSGIVVQGEPETLRTRYTYSDQAQTAGYYMAERLAALGYPVELQWFNALGAWVCNVVATKTGFAAPEEIYVVGAHYDSKSEDPFVLAPGANDNGSGASVLLEAARVMAGAPLAATVQFAAFAAEEQGALGSEEFVARALAAGDSIAGAVILDMVSYYTTSYQLQVEGEHPWEWLMDVMAAACEEYTHLTTAKTYYSWGSDHVSFQEAGIAAFLAIEDEWASYPCYHMTCDTLGLQRFDFGYDVARATVAAIASLARILPPSGVPADPVGHSSGLSLTACPNPFNPQTNLSFDLPHPGRVRLAVFDARGREVVVLVDEHRDGGRQLLEWVRQAGDAASLGSGVYFLSLSLDQDRITRRIVIAR